jgi:hypothetical protein
METVSTKLRVQRIVDEMLTKVMGDDGDERCSGEWPSVMKRKEVLQREVRELPDVLMDGTEKQKAIGSGARRSALESTLGQAKSEAEPEPGAQAEKAL